MPEEKKKTGRQQKSGHGSLTKAGKVRNRTPKIEASPHRPLCPRLDNRIKYERATIKQHRRDDYNMKHPERSRKQL